MPDREKLDVHSKLMGFLQRAPYIGCEDVHRQYAVNWLMNNGVTIQQWIPVSEPPEDTNDYWVTYKGGDVRFYSTGYFDGKCWRSAVTQFKIPVTHWMPIIEPPKGE